MVVSRDEKVMVVISGEEKAVLGLSKMGFLEKEW